ncbi:MAG: general secretion pathway protein GspB [PVC group bacterium]|nr:general secretion pathway protein GspB [PVC group bacterium]
MKKIYRQNRSFIYIIVIGAILFLGKLGFVSSQEDELVEEKVSFTYESNDRRDPFIPSLDVSGIRPTMKPVVKKEELNKRLAKIDVNGILWDKAMPLVMINNKIHKQGDTIFDLDITEIKENSVIFSYEELTHEISLIQKQ